MNDFENNLKKYFEKTGRVLKDINNIKEKGYGKSLYSTTN